MKVCILGSGAYGIALASRFLVNGNQVVCYSNDESEINELLINRATDKLKGYSIPSDIEFTRHLSYAINGAVLIVIAVPAKVVSSITLEIRDYITKDMHILIASKGIIGDSCLFISDVVMENLNTNNVAVISGPSFAIDVVNGKEIGLTLASVSSSTRELVNKLLVSDKLKLENITDLIGIQVCGAVKNTMAVMCGILGGMGVSESTRALFLTEALNDIKDLIVLLNGDKDTILSYSGFGDFLMTCISFNSRNYTYGKMIGEGKSDEANNYLMANTVEGVYTLGSIRELIKRKDISMPIIDLLSDVISGKVDKECILEFLIKK